MNEEIHCINNKKKTTKNKWEDDDSDFLQALYSVCKKIRTILFPQYSLTYLKKNKSVLFKVINNWTN